MPRRIDLDRSAQSSAIAAAEHDGRLAEIAQYLHQRQHRRGLAGAADMIIADAEHGDANVKTLALQSPACDQPVKGAERHQQQRYPRRAPVPEARLTHSPPPFRAAVAADTAPARRAF